MLAEADPKTKLKAAYKSPKMLYHSVSFRAALVGDLKGIYIYIYIYICLLCHSIDFVRVSLLLAIVPIGTDTGQTQ